MRLIDADEFKKYIWNWRMTCPCENEFQRKIADILLEGYFEDIDKQPTVNPELHEFPEVRESYDNKQMTYSKAYEILKNKLICINLQEEHCVEKRCDENCDECKYCYLQGTIGEQTEALAMAIKALEKQKAEKALIIKRHSRWKILWECPNCHSVYENGCNFRFDFCPNCGQRIDWEEVEENE